ncbi:hypothetical protein [Pseudomonas indica]|uniref:hypothetical protein n=1 Tax=Pseudomonas indica TaxID=137658 RepID=UPI003FD3FA0B
MQTITAAELPAIGQPLAGGTFVTRYWLNGQEFALVALPAESELTGAWGEYGQDVPGANSYSDGMANTIAMAAAGSEIAGRIMDIGEGTFIPAAFELNLLFAAKQAGVLSDFNGSWYWSSSQRSAYGAFHMGFGGGTQGYYDKYNEFRVRPVRRLLIQ